MTTATTKTKTTSTPPAGAPLKDRREALERLAVVYGLPTTIRAIREKGDPALLAMIHSPDGRALVSLSSRFNRGRDEITQTGVKFASPEDAFDHARRLLIAYPR